MSIENKCPHGIPFSRWDTDGTARFCLICYPQPAPDRKGIGALRKRWNTILAKAGLSVNAGLFVGPTKLVYMRDNGKSGQETVDETYRPEDRGEQRGQNQDGQDDLLSWLRYVRDEPVRREKELVGTLAEMFLRGSCTEWAKALDMHPQQVQRIRQQLMESESPELEEARRVVGMTDWEWRDRRLRTLLAAARISATRQTFCE